MPIPLGAILAQVITLGVADRTEGRRIVNGDAYYEAATVPAVTVRSAWHHLTLSLGYGATVTETPLDSPLPSPILFNTAFLGAAYTWQRTTLTLGASVGYGDLNFATQALAGNGVGVLTLPGGTPAGNPTPAAGDAGGNAGSTPNAPLPIGTVVGAGGVPVGAGTPGTGVPAANQVRALNQIVRYGSVTTSVGVTHAATPTVQLGAQAGYSEAGAVRAADKLKYPVVRGPQAGASVRYRLDPVDNVTSSVAVQYAEASNGGNSTWLGTASEGWAHRLNPHASTQLTVGVGGTRSPLGNGFVSYSVYPAAQAGIIDSMWLARGSLALSFSVSIAPVLDPVAAVVDPRLTIGAGVGWNRDRFTTSLTVGTSLSVADQTNAGALSAVGAAFGVGYRLAKAVGIDGGVRAAYQRFQGQTVVPLSYAVFVGLSFGAATTLR